MKRLIAAFALSTIAVIVAGCATGPDDEATGESANAFTATRQLRCESYDYRYNTCGVGGHIRNARVVRQLSSSRCDEGRSWGYQDNYIWVDQGCRADFEVNVSDGWGRYEWVWSYTDHHNGCHSCTYSCDAPRCDESILGKTKACHTPGTHDDSDVYECRRVGW